MPKWSAMLMLLVLVLILGGATARGHTSARQIGVQVGTLQASAEATTVPTPADAPSTTLLRTFTGHTAMVNSVAFAPDGKAILSGGNDHQAILWNLASGQVLRTFTVPLFVSSVAFAPDGKTMLLGTDPGAILWNVTTGARLRTVRGSDTAYVFGVSFAPDSKTVLAGLGHNDSMGGDYNTEFADDVAILWDVASGRKLRTFSGHRDWVRGVAFAPDGKTILTGSYDTTAILWDVASGKHVRTFGAPGRVTSVAFAPDGKTFVTGGADKLNGSGNNTAILWDVASGQALHTFRGHTDWLTSVAFAPNGKTVLTGSADGTAILWDAAGGFPLRVFRATSGGIYSVAFAPDGKSVLACDELTLKLWDISDLAE